MLISHHLMELSLYMMLKEALKKGLKEKEEPTQKMQKHLAYCRLTVNS